MLWKTKFRELENDFEEFRNSSKILEEELESETVELKSEVTDLHVQLRSILKAKGPDMKDMDKLVGKIQTLTKWKNEFTMKCRRLENDNDQLSSNLRASSIRVKDLEEEVEAQHETVVMLQEQLEQLKEECLLHDVPRNSNSPNVKAMSTHGDDNNVINLRTENESLYELINKLKTNQTECEWCRDMEARIEEQNQEIEELEDVTSKLKMKLERESGTECVKQFEASNNSEFDKPRDMIDVAQEGDVQQGVIWRPLDKIHLESYTSNIDIEPSFVDLRFHSLEITSQSVVSHVETELTKREDKIMKQMLQLVPFTESLLRHVGIPHKKSPPEGPIKQVSSSQKDSRNIEAKVADLLNNKEKLLQQIAQFSSSKIRNKFAVDEFKVTSNNRLPHIIPDLKLISINVEPEVYPLGFFNYNQIEANTEGESSDGVFSCNQLCIEKHKCSMLFLPYDTQDNFIAVTKSSVVFEKSSLHDQIMPEDLISETKSKIHDKSTVTTYNNEVEHLPSMISTIMPGWSETAEVKIDKRLSELDEENNELMDWLSELNEVKTILGTAKVSLRTNDTGSNKKNKKLKVDSPKAKNEIEHLKTQTQIEDDGCQFIKKQLELKLKQKESQMEKIVKELERSKAAQCSTRNKLEGTRNIAIVHQATATLLRTEAEFSQKLAGDVIETSLKLLKEKSKSSSEEMEAICSKRKLLERSRNSVVANDARMAEFRKENVTSLADSLTELEALKVKLKETDAEIKALSDFIRATPCPNEISGKSNTGKQELQEGLLHLQFKIQKLHTELQASRSPNFKQRTIDQESARFEEAFCKIDTNIELLRNIAHVKEKQVLKLKSHQAISQKLCSINQTLQNNIDAHKDHIERLEKSHDAGVNDLLAKLTQQVVEGNHVNQDVIKLLWDEIGRTTKNKGYCGKEFVNRLRDSNTCNESGPRAVSLETFNKTDDADHVGDPCTNNTNTEVNFPNRKCKFAICSQTTNVSISNSTYNAHNIPRRKYNHEQIRETSPLKQHNNKKQEVRVNLRKSDYFLRTKDGNICGGNLKKSVYVPAPVFVKLSSLVKQFLKIKDETASIKTDLGSIILDSKVMAKFITEAFSEIMNILSGVRTPEDNRVQLHLVRKQLSEETMLRRKFWDELQRMKGYIRVYCRVRPLLEKERKKGIEHAVNFQSHNCIALFTNVPLTQGGCGVRQHTFNFHRCFDGHKNQSDIFEDLKLSVLNVLDGFHVCIFAYGITGSGKTYTIEGPKSNPGIRERALGELYTYISNHKHEYDFEVRVSLLEIYNNQLQDLLLKNKEERVPLMIYTDKNGATEVKNIRKIPVSSISEVLEVLQQGTLARVVGFTEANDRSSRSHVIATLYLQSTSRLTQKITEGRLNIVDLAGSERLKFSQPSGERMSETVHINKSLTALGDVMRALGKRQDDKEVHVPYRNSKLTQLLQSSLENSITYMIINISPASIHTQETFQSLQFAKRVGSIKIGQATSFQHSKNILKTNSDMQELSNKCRMLSKQLTEARNKNKVMVSGIASSRDSLQVELDLGKKQIKNLRDTIGSYRSMNEKHAKAVEKIQLLDKNILTWKRKYEILVKKYLIKTGEVDSLTQKARAFENEIVRVQQNSCAISRNVIAKRKEDNGKSNAKIDTLNKHIAKLGKENTSLQAKVHLLRQNVKIKLSREQRFPDEKSMTEKTASPTLSSRSNHEAVTSVSTRNFKKFTMVKDVDDSLAVVSRDKKTHKSRGFRKSPSQRKRNKQAAASTASSPYMSPNERRKLKQSQNEKSKPRSNSSRSNKSPNTVSSPLLKTPKKFVPTSARKYRSEEKMKSRQRSSTPVYSCDSHKNSTEKRHNNAIQKHIDRTRQAKLLSQSNK